MTTPLEVAQPQPVDRLRRLVAALETGNTPSPDDDAWFTTGAMGNKLTA
jgi:hypothetical protein